VRRDVLNVKSPFLSVITSKEEFRGDFSAVSQLTLLLLLSKEMVAFPVQRPIIEGR
jgi:hypothetical protein